MQQLLKQVQNRIVQLNRTLSYKMSQSNEVLFYQVTPYMTEVLLNRPLAFNALNLNMIREIRKQISDWNNSTTQLVYFNGEGNKAFCAGGDIKSLYNYKQNPQGENILDTFFREEFELDYLLAKMKPVQLSVFDGIVMGGGVGISIHSKIKVATDSSLFAMPEAKIGFFTDVGASFFLTRLKKKIGMYLALTGQRIKAQELLQTGIANFYVKFEDIELMKKDLEKTVNSCSDYQVIKDIVDKYSQKVDNIYPNEDYIQDLFNFKTYEDFAANLKKRVENGDAFAVKVQSQLQQQSPLSLRVIFQQLTIGESQSLEECMKMDFRITQRFMDQTEFFEGVRCTLVDKNDNPKWKYSDPLQIPQQEIDLYFQLLDSDKELVLKKS